jgi:prepilin-type N-terminal cleavage/methylation domain-containing protein
MTDGVFVRQGRGFTILEVMISCAILAILGSLTVPSIASYVQHRRIRESVTTLEQLAVAINSFHATVNNWPAHLSDLTTNISAGQHTACTGVDYLFPTRWVNGGPFFGQAIPRTGFKLPIGVANDSLERVPNSAATGMLNIVIPNVRFQDAQAMNDISGGPGDVNGPDRSNTSGVIRWSAPNQDERVTLTYGVPVTRFC